MSDPVREAIEASIATVTRIATTPTTTRYGVDLKCVADVDSRMSETSDDTVESLAQDLYHRVTTPRGGVPDAQDFGEDLAAYLSGDVQPGDLRSIEGRVASECQKDDRVSRVEVSITQPDPRSFTCTIRVTPENPDLVAFSLIIPVTDGKALLEATLKEQG